MNNFFNDPKFQAELKHDADRAREQIVNKKKLATPAVGDSFLFAESIELPVRWVCVLPHVDNSSLWYLIAADEYSETGTCDIELPESHAWAPLTLRCSVGFWAHRDDLNAGDYLGRLEHECIVDARNRLAEMLAGQVPVTKHGLMAEASEDYREWLVELAELADQIEARLQAKPIVLGKIQLDSAWTNHILIAERLAGELALAADSVGSQPEVTPGLAHVLPSKLPGALLLQRDGSAFDLVYYPAKDETPPRLLFVNGRASRLGEWYCGPDGVLTWSQSLAPMQDRLDFTVGAETFEILVS
jgi:hypothetical protein